MLVALAASAGARLLVAAGPVDEPGSRSAHVRPTPTSGGLAILAALGLGLLLLPASLRGPPEEAKDLAAAFGLAALLGLVGAVDDLLDLGPRLKLIAQSGLALAFAFFARVEAIPIGADAALGLGPLIGGFGTAFWIVLVVNAVNFMDGANGLASGCLSLMFLVLAGILGGRGDLPLAALALLGAAANLGFLPFNFPKARLFQGDAGALFSGFLLAALAVVAAGRDGRGPAPVLVVPTLLLPFLADVLFTLLRRARGGRPLFRAHAEHLYQRWMGKHGGSHVGLCLRMLFLVGLCALASIGIARLSRIAPGAAMGAFVVVVGLSAVAWRWLSATLDLSPAGMARPIRPS